MASSSLHARSISLPSTPNPRILDVYENLRRLSSLETSTSSSSLSNSLSMLRDLYDSVEVFLNLPHTQQMLIQENHRSSVDELLNASLCFLDVCGTAKDVLSQTKEQAQKLQSILRRKQGYSSEVAKEAEKFLVSRKMSKKAISKSLKDLKNNCSVSSSDKINEEATLSTLTRVEQVTFTLFESLLSTISGPRGSSWSFVTKLVPSKSSRVSCEEEASEFQTVDCLLHAIIKKNNVKDKEDVQNELRKLEFGIQNLEDELDSLLRCMIRSRVFLLNILTL